MKPLSSCLLFFLLLLLPARADVPLATWNVHNLLLVDRYEEGRFRLQYPMPEARKKRLRQQLLAVRPQVLLLQEVGSAGFLRELQLDLAAAGLDYPHTAFSAAPQVRSGLAVLSAIPLDEVVFHDPVPLATPAAPDAVLTRGIQEVAFTAAGLRWHVFHVHLKSRFSNDPADPDARSHRAAEVRALAAFLAARLRAAPAATRFVLAGDFNTPFDDPLLQPLRAAWRPLPAADTNGTAWTYQHNRSGARETLDGFWVPCSQPDSLLPAGILPAANPPSDHRMVVVAWNSLATAR